jgi:hypothetical protein
MAIARNSRMISFTITVSSFPRFNFYHFTGFIFDKKEKKLPESGMIFPLSDSIRFVTAFSAEPPALPR